MTRVEHAILFLSVVLHLALVHQVLRAAPGAGVDRGMLGRVFHDVRHTAGPGADFYALYHAGISVRHGRSPYTEGPDGVTPYYYPYRYLPFTAETLGRAMTALSPRAAYVTWIVVLELLLAAWCVTLWRRTRRGAGLRLVTLHLVSAPFVLELYMGQFTFAAAVLACLGTLTWQTQSKRGLAALAIGAAIHLKVYPALVLPTLIDSRKDALWVTAICASVVLPNAVLFAGDTAASAAFWSRNFVGEAAGLDAGNHSLLYLLHVAGYALGQDWDLPLWGAFTILWRLLVLALAVSAALRARRRPLEARVSLLVLAHFLSYFQVWEHHYSAVIVAGALLMLSDNMPRVLISTTLLFLAVPGAFVFLGPATEQWTSLERLLSVACKALPLAVLFIIALRHTVIAHSGAAVTRND